MGICTCCVCLQVCVALVKHCSHTTAQGDADGLGNLREQELYDSLSVFGVGRDRIRVVDDA